MVVKGRGQTSVCEQSACGYCTGRGQHRPSWVQVLGGGLLRKPVMLIIWWHHSWIKGSLWSSTWHVYTWQDPGGLHMDNQNRHWWDRMDVWIDEQIGQFNLWFYIVNIDLSVLFFVCKTKLCVGKRISCSHRQLIIGYHHRCGPKVCLFQVVIQSVNLNENSFYPFIQSTVNKVYYKCNVHINRKQNIHRTLCTGIISAL